MANPPFFFFWAHLDEALDAFDGGISRRARSVVRCFSKSLNGASGTVSPPLCATQGSRTTSLVSTYRRSARRCLGGTTKSQFISRRIRRPRVSGSAARKHSAGQR